MSKTTSVTDALPPIALKALRELGENIAIARLRRREPQRAWAERIGISVPTYVRLEKGDPSVSMAAYAAALWLMGRVQALPAVAAPESDLAALERDVRAARKRERVRTPASVAARLAGIDKSGRK
jgi:transcriptional regulator with XRE-family HTH domain